MILFLILFLLIILLIASLMIVPNYGKSKNKIAFIDEEKEIERPWILVEKGPDSTFTEGIKKKDE